MANMTTLLENDFLLHYLKNAGAITPATTVDVVLFKGTFDKEAPASGTTIVGTDGAGDGLPVSVTADEASFASAITIEVTDAGSTAITGFAIAPTTTTNYMFAGALAITVNQNDSVQFAANTGLTITSA